jgi:hypothetical protein
MIANGWVSIHPLQRTWRLHLPSAEPFPRLAKRKHLKLQLGNWKKMFLITKNPPASPLIAARVRIRRNKNNYIAGPFVGILTVAGKPLFRGVKSNFIDIIQTGQRMGAFIYVMPIENIDWDSLTVVGYLFDQHKRKWLKEHLPLPHVIYNRIPNRSFEKKPHVKMALERLSSLEGVCLYNPHFFNKHQLFTVLQKNEEILPYIPKTIPLLGKEVLYEMIASYPLLYLKPSNGMAGKGIFRLQKRQGEYSLRYHAGTDTIAKSFKTKKELWGFLSPRLKKGYLIQQGIHLATYEGKLFDIRLLAQKNGKGYWGVTGMGIRLAGTGKITTHVPQGGSIQSLRSILPIVFPQYSGKELTTSIRHAALWIAHALEKEWTTLGEVSMDIGIDKEGKIWLIEANAKPGKFDEPHIRKLSLQRIVEYAQHQALFTENAGGENDVRS